MAVLREFDLDIPYVPNEEYIQSLVTVNNWEYEQATKFDYEQNWKAKRLAFRDQIRSVCSLYERCFERFVTNNCWKVLVDCVALPRDQKARDFGGVFSIEVPFEPEAFFTASDYEKKKLTLETLKLGIDLLVQNQQWERQPFEKAYNEVINKNYINTWTWKKAKSSPTRAHLAEVYCEHEVRQFNVYILIKNQNGTELKREKIITERPHEFSYARHFGKLKWVSNNEVSLCNKLETECWRVRV